MINVKEETIETFVELHARDGNKYLYDIEEEILKENNALMYAIVNNADKVVEYMDKYAEDIPGQLKCLVRANIISACLAVYQTIKAQHEADELERLYG